MNNNQKFSVKFYQGSIRFVKWLTLSIITLITLVFLLEILLAIITTIIGANTTIATAMIEVSMMTALGFMLLTKWNIYQMWKRFFTKVFRRFNQIQVKRAKQKEQTAKK